jgi:hypothetical protein
MSKDDKDYYVCSDCKHKCDVDKIRMDTKIDYKNIPLSTNRSNLQIKSNIIKKDSDNYILTRLRTNAKENIFKDEYIRVDTIQNVKDKLTILG